MDETIGTSAEENLRGQADPSEEEAGEIFENFWNDFTERHSWDEVVVPRLIVWLNGAPGSGKGTNTPHVAKELAISSPAIVTGELLDGERFMAIKEEGGLIDDEVVVGAVFNELFDGSRGGGVIVDGFPRTATQAECVKLLYDKILSLGQRSKFLLLLFEVSEQASVERQLGRGREAAIHNRTVAASGKGNTVPLRKTDSDSRAAARRYRIYVEQTKMAERIMETHFPSCAIDGSGSIEAVRDSITKALGQVMPA